MFICCLCKKEIPVEDVVKMKDGTVFCLKCVNEIIGAFSYSIGGVEVTKDTFDRVKENGKV
jgi:hypothetical protein